MRKARNVSVNVDVDVDGDGDVDVGATVDEVRVRLTAGGKTVEVGYCYNVLPGETVGALIDQVRRICGPVRERLGVARMGVGLWIARRAATELRGCVGELRRALEEHGLYCFTLNGFPYGGFHAPRVKERVFEPTWADDARVEYTIELGEVLRELMPEDVAWGSISTVPLGPVGVDRARARDGIARAAEALAAMRIELAVEPEPGAEFERVDELGRFLDGVASVCLDCCHAAVVGEDPVAALASARCAKVQISSALVAERPDERLAAFDEPRFLHQVRSERGGAMDLPEALEVMDRGVPWRIHFHVPVHREAVGGLGTTRDAIGPVLEAVLASERPPHLEVETYTWSVLPEAERPVDDAGLVEGIARELAWTIERLRELGAA